MSESIPRPTEEPLLPGSTQNLSEIVRRKLATGELPKGEHAKLTLNLGLISSCDGCDRPITGMEHLTELHDGRKFRFHAVCMDMWDRERLAGGEQARFVIPQPDWEGNDSADVDREARCAGCGSRIQPFAGRYRVKSASFHPECYERAQRTDGAPQTRS